MRVRKDVTHSVSSNCDDELRFQVGGCGGEQERQDLGSSDRTRDFHKGRATTEEGEYANVSRGSSR